MELLVAVVLHKYTPSQALAVKVALEPGHIAPEPVTTNFVGIAFTTTLTGFLSTKAVSQPDVLFLHPTL
jgi:hypothetical protein